MKRFSSKFPVLWQNVLCRCVTSVLIFFAVSSLSSCFTGVESTKKINLSREDKKLAHLTPEERFMEQIETSPLKEWENGKRFIVSDDKALLVITPIEGVIPVAPDSVKGKTLEFSGIHSKINPAGQPTVSLLFTDGIYLYSYDTGKHFDDAMENLRSDQVPMLIDEDMVNKARKLLSGKNLWTKSNLWYDSKGNRIDGKKFIEVRVLDVQPGNMIFPLFVEFKSDSDPAAFVFMNFGSAGNESRSFHNLFSLSDIKKHYSSVDPDMWDLISRGKLKPGMTKEEVKLSIGNPTDLNSGHDYSQTLDIWRYDNGTVIWFEDGRIVKIRQ